MNKTASPDSSATKLDPEDRDALDRLNGDLGGSANQGAAPSTPGASAPQGAAAPTPNATLWAGHVAALCNQFFISRFGEAGAIPETILAPIKADLAAAIDAYLPQLDAKPGIFAAVALGSHFVTCQQRARANARPSGSSDKVEPEKVRSSNALPEETPGS